MLDSDAEPYPSIQSAAPVDTNHWTSHIGVTDACTNCGVAKSGTFCPECGQKHLHDRLNFRTLASSLFSQLTNVEKGLFHTFWELLRRPGKVAKDYCEGRQKSYVNPLSYFFVGAACQLVSLLLVGKRLRVQMEASIAEALAANGGADTAARMSELLGGDPATKIADCYFSAIQQGYAYAGLFCFCFPFALLLMAMHRLLGEKFRLGELTVFSLYTFGQMLVITAIATPIAFRFGSTLQMVQALAVYALLPQLAHTGFFQGTIPARFMTLLATVIATATFFLSIMTIFVASIVLAIIAN